MLRHSQAKAVFCEDAAQLGKIEQVRERDLLYVIAFDGAIEGSLSLADPPRPRRRGLRCRPRGAVAGISDDQTATLV